MTLEGLHHDTNDAVFCIFSPICSFLLKCCRQLCMLININLHSFKHYNGYSLCRRSRTFTSLVCCGYMKLLLISLLTNDTSSRPIYIFKTKYLHYVLDYFPTVNLSSGIVWPEGSLTLRLWIHIIKLPTRKVVLFCPEICERLFFSAPQ